MCVSRGGCSCVAVPILKGAEVAVDPRDNEYNSSPTRETLPGESPLVAVGGMRLGPEVVGSVAVGDEAGEFEGVWSPRETAITRPASSSSAMMMMSCIELTKHSCI